MSYSLITNFHNISTSQIYDSIVTIGCQNLRPVGWFFIDDGSQDNGRARKYAEQMCKDFGIRCMSVTVEPHESDIRGIGRAWNVMLPYLKGSTFNSTYLAQMDFDNYFPEHYFERVIKFLEENPDVGATAGRAKGHPVIKTSRVQGGGKVFRRHILDSVDEIWKMAPDSFINIKARAAGYRVMHLRGEHYEFESPQAAYFSEIGQKRYGMNIYYRGTHPFLALYIMLRSTHKMSFIRGYRAERKTGDQTKDVDVRYESSLRFAMRRLWRRIKK